MQIDGVEVHEVDSSNLELIGYDTSEMILVVQFRNGSAYRYFNVPEYLYDGLCSAPSLGSFFHHNIRNSYNFERIY